MRQAGPRYEEAAVSRWSYDSYDSSGQREGTAFPSVDPSLKYLPIKIPLMHRYGYKGRTV